MSLTLSQRVKRQRDYMREYMRNYRVKMRADGRLPPLKGGRKIQYIRCPACGKLSRGQNFGQTLTAEGHRFATRWCCLYDPEDGQRIKWPKPEERVTKEIALMVLQALRAAERRVLAEIQEVDPLLAFAERCKSLGPVRSRVFEPDPVRRRFPVRARQTTFQVRTQEVA